MMASMNDDADNDQPPGTSDADYALAFAVVARIKRAATDLAYRIALYEAYAASGLAHLIPTLVRAIDEYRRNNGTGEPVAA